MIMKVFYKYMIVTAVMLGGFSSCGLYKKYERPELHFVDSLYRRLPDLQDTVSIASLSWREFFSDTLLCQWIELGLANNTDLAIARFRVDQAQADLMAARQAFFPSVSFSAGGGASISGSQYSAGPAFSWEADIFGKVANAKRGAAAALKQSEAYRQAVQTQLIATIAESYYRMLMLDQQLLISQRTLKTWEENIRTLEALKRAGKTNEAAVLQAKANRLDVQSSVYTLYQQIFEAENAFAALLGMVPQNITRGDLDKQTTMPYPLSGGIPAQILSNRPDVRQAEMALAQAFYATNQARSSFYPSIRLTGDIGFDPTGFIAGLTASLLQPIYARGVNKAALRKAEAQQKIAAYEFRQSLLDAGVEVNNALIAVKTANSKVKIDQKQIVHLQAAVWNTQLLMKHGNTNYLEVLTAQQKLLQAELAEVSDRFEEIRNVINLYHALGGGSEVSD